MSGSKKIKIIHTSDWHLGKRLFRKDRAEEHALFLKWLQMLLKESQADALILAGDVFDSPNPPHSSLKMYYDFLKSVGDMGIPCVVISGNHDSQGLIQAPQSLVKESNIFLRAKLSSSLEENIVKLNLQGQEVWVKCMPYFRNHELVQLAQDHGLLDEEDERDEVAKRALSRFFSHWPAGAPAAKILLAHHVFGSFSATGSEHFIGVSGIDSIPLEMLQGQFDYAALGHIHKYQTLGQDPLTVYTGSPLQMRFSEHKQKYVSLIEIDPATSSVTAAKTPIPVFRELIQIKTNSSNCLADVEKRLDSWRQGQGQLAPFVEVQVEMLEARSGLVDMVKEICEARDAQLLSFLPTIKSPLAVEAAQEDMRQLDMVELFRRFYREKFPENEGPPELLEERFKSLLEEISMATQLESPADEAKQ